MLLLFLALLLEIALAVSGTSAQTGANQTASNPPASPQTGSIQTAAKSKSAAVPVRLNISWSSDSPRYWDGCLTLSSGFFWNSVPLGSDPAASVTFARSEENQGRIPFSTPAPVPFSGIQTTAVAPLDEPVRIELRTKTGDRIDRTFRLRELMTAPIQIPLGTGVSERGTEGGTVQAGTFDARGGSLYIERAAGDMIPLSVSRTGGERFEQPNQMTPSMVFDTGETLIIGIFTQYLPVSGTSCRLRLSLNQTAAESTTEPLWTASYDVTPALAAEHPRLDLSVPLTDIDGPFEVTIELTAADKGAAEKGRFPIIGQKGQQTVLARRTVQGVAVAHYRQNYQTAETAQTPSGWRGKLLETVDPTNPSWWQIFSRRKFFPEPMNPFKKQEKTLPGSTADGAAGGAVHSEQAQTSDSAYRGQMPAHSAAAQNPVQEADRGNADKGSTVEFLKKWRLGELRTRIPSLYSDISWGQWDSFWQHPLGSGDLVPLDDPTGRSDSFVQLNRSANPLHPSWEAYTLPVKEPGKPHILEIDYPADMPMAFGVSIIEPSVTGGVFPRTLDGGVNVNPNPLSDRMEGRVRHYQVLFWPKSQTPTILITAPDPKRPALYGRIRLFRAKDDFAPPQTPLTGGRSFTAVMTRPFLCDQFLAPRKPSPVGVIGAEDWETFYSAAERMTDYLAVSGYDSLLMSVAADGSALYPSAVLRPNPKYDSGLFLADGPDPVRKDVPELICRLFDQRGMTFMPMVDFNAPIPLLEEGAASQSDSIYWIGLDGQPYQQTREDGTVFCPYNLLNLKVQEALLQAVNELAARYAHHRSFGGVGLELSAESAAVLPQNPYLGLDDETFGAFASDMISHTAVVDEIKRSIQEAASAADDDRFRRRGMLLRESIGSYWLAWRADIVTRFCSKAASLLTARSPEAKLHLVWTAPIPDLSASELLTSETDRAAVRAYALIQAGYDPKRLAKDRSLVFYRPGRLAPDAAPFRQWSNQDGETAGFLSNFEIDGATPGAFFYHEAVPRNLPTFDAASPFHPTVTDLETILLPSDEENRRRFAHQAAVSDTLRLADGGRMIPIGEEESLYEWIDVWRRLPNRPFATTNIEEKTSIPDASADSPVNREKTSSPGESIQPVVFRTLRTEDAFWAYLVNDAPYHCGVNLSIRYTPLSSVEVFVGGRTATAPDTMGGDFRWNLSLRPYDLVALKIADPAAEPVSLEVLRPEEICASGGRMQAVLEAAADRIFMAAGGLAVPISNPGLNSSPSAQYRVEQNTPSEEESKNMSVLGLDISKVNLLKNRPENNLPAPSAPNPLAGWQILGAGPSAVTSDNVRFVEGDASIRLSNAGNGSGMVSSPFDLPASGRLFVCAAFGLPENCPDLPLQVVLAGECGGKAWERKLVIGPSLLRRGGDAIAAGSAVRTDGVFWIRDVLLFDDLPSEAVSHATIRFELYDRGTLWLDEVALYSTALMEREKTVQAEAIRQAAAAYNENRVSDAAAFLDYGAVPLFTEAIPDHSPLWASCPKRPEYARFGSFPAEETESGQPIETASRPEENASSGSGKKKNFFQKIIPW